MVSGQPGAPEWRADRPGAAADSRVPRAGADAGHPRDLHRRAQEQDAGTGDARTAARARLGGEQPIQGTSERADRTHRVFRFPVPVLFARRPDRAPGVEHLRRQDPVRLSPLPAPQPSVRASRGRGRGVRPRAGQVLAVSRPAVREPVKAERRGLQAARGNTGPEYRAIQRVRGHAQAKRRSGSRYEGW